MRHTLLWLVALVASNAPLVQSQQRIVHGIAFEIDTIVFDANAIRPDRDALREWRAFATYTATVRFAAGRGRLDITSRHGGPAIIVDSAARATPIAAPGDYYLFDSLGYLLVRPKSKTFTRVRISYDSFNYEGDRSGWPTFFQLVAPHVDTVKTAPQFGADRPRTIRIYWHADATPNMSLARGWMAVDNVPMGEFNVARWFAASRAIAHLVDSTHAIPSGRVSVTAAVPRAPPRIRDVPVSFLLKQEFIRLREADIARSQLALPRGFVEKPANAGERPR